MRGLATLGLLAGVLAMSACGFHPRGSLSVVESLGPVRVVTADPYSSLAQDLSRGLSRSGAESAGADQKAAQLRVLAEQLSTTPLTVDESAFVREYTTRYRVEFRLDAADGSIRLPAQEIELSRDYTFDSFASAGNPAEQELVEKELRRDMIAAILRQLDMALRTQP